MPAREMKEERAVPAERPGVCMVFSQNGNGLRHIENSVCSCVRSEGWLESREENTCRSEKGVEAEERWA